MSHVRLLTANLVTVVIESLFYGGYLVVVLLALYLTSQSNKSSNERGHWLISPLIVGTFGLFLAVTAHWALNISRLFMAFHEWEEGPAPRIFYSDLSHITEVLKYGFLLTSITLGDIFLIHRLWAVWALSRRIIVVPIITLVAFIVFGVGLVYQLTQYMSQDDIYRSPYRRWITGVCFFSVCTNLYTSVLIYWKLWVTTHALRPLGSAGFTNIILIFFESATFTAFWGLFHVVSYQAQSNLQFIAIDCTPPVIGIASLFIHVRLHLDRTHALSPRTGRTTSIQFASVCRSGRDDESEVGFEAKSELTRIDTEDAYSRS
ncbi:hypothetical protein C8J57DRAFT_1341036 [Mycena rebaudengoi]|nr:hypothetical protein C8J57DRAFT_1341036 [Mycena rebaudengoi]